MLTITKRFEFCYGHRLPGYDGRCANFHGHNSVVEVEVAGRDKESYTTMVMDFGKLKKIVNPLLDELDHQDITMKFQGSPPTAETICRWLSLRIKEALPQGVNLVRVRVTETPNSWAEERRAADENH